MSGKRTPCKHGLPVTKCPPCLKEYHRAKYEELIMNPARYKERADERAKKIADLRNAADAAMRELQYQRFASHYPHMDKSVCRSIFEAACRALGCDE